MMGASAVNSELSLDCKAQSYSMVLKSFGDSSSTRLQLEDYLSRLEEERLKIEAFKRELPLCMHLLSNAMEASRQQLQSCKATSANQGIKRPVLEEFIPMKHSNSEGPPDHQKPPNSTSDKASWMTSAQLWSQDNEGATTKQQLASLSSKDLDIGFSPKLSLLDNNNDNNKRPRNGRAFLPFTKERNSTLNDLALASDDQRPMEDSKGLKTTNESCQMASENSAKLSNGIGMTSSMDHQSGAQTNVNGAATTTSQTHRKQRRCWSPDLHRRFVNALQMLGGSQVATPKQIRELMKVDGLTNDEVKSHLQKYRLHTRRPGPGPQGPGATGPQLVVLGGIWVPQEYAAAAHHHGVPPPTIYSAQPTAQVGPHYFPPTMPQEFYPPPPLPPHHHHHHRHHQVQLYKASSQGHSSLESHGGRGERERSESIEEGKSESSSGEECNERKKLASMREAEEESNGSEIILKF